MIALIVAWVVWSGVRSATESAGELAKPQSPTRAHRAGNESSAKGLRGPRSSSACCSRCPAPPTSPGSRDQQAELLDDRDGAGSDRLQPDHALAARGPARRFLVAPDWTPRAIERGKVWVSRHSRTFVVRGLTLFAVLMIPRESSGSSDAGAGSRLATREEASGARRRWVSFPFLVPPDWSAPSRGTGIARLTIRSRKTGMGGFVHRGFESLPLRCSGETAPFEGQSHIAGPRAADPTRVNGGQL